MPRSRKAWVFGEESSVVSLQQDNSPQYSARQEGPESSVVSLQQDNSPGRFTFLTPFNWELGTGTDEFWLMADG